MQAKMQAKKQYYAFYSNTAVENRGRRHAMSSSSIADKDEVKYNIYMLADGSGYRVHCTAVYECDKYASPEEVLENYYKFPDAKFVGIVDQWMQTVYA